jgi:hypothetical protein
MPAFSMMVFTRFISAVAIISEGGAKPNRLACIKQTNPRCLLHLKMLNILWTLIQGQGAAFPVAINPSNDITDYPVPINVTGQTAASHRLYWRPRNATGNWSQTNNLSYTINTAVSAPAIVVSSITSKSFCAWGGFRLSHHPTGTYNPGNIFTAQLSDANGNFAIPSIIGSLATTGAAIMNVTLPSHSPDGAGYKVRIVSSDSVVAGMTGQDNTL